MLLLLLQYIYIAPSQDNLLRSAPSPSLILQLYSHTDSKNEEFACTVKKNLKVCTKEQFVRS